MIRYLIGSGGKTVAQTNAPQKNCWIHLEAPTTDEIAEVAELTGLPVVFLRTALDEEEAAHLDYEDDAKLIVVDIPKMIQAADGESYEIFTLPLALIQCPDYLVTVCTRPTSVLNDFFKGKIKNADPAQRAKLVYQIMYNNAVRFLYYLRQIDKASDNIQKSLAKSMQNKGLLQLLDLQKSLVFFSASLTANYAVIQKISHSAAHAASEDERDILEDVIIESKQALEMCTVYREIIKSAMDAFASVVNNNQNIVMKILTIITVIISIPMMLAGFWGMNTAVPFEGTLWGFWAAVGISMLFSAIVAVILLRKKVL